MATIQGGTLVVSLEGRDVNLSELLTKVENQMQKGATTAKNFDNTIAQLTASEKRNESALASYAQAQARFAEASGNSNLAVQRLVAAMQQLTPNTAAANSVLTQIQGTLNRQAAAAEQAAAAQARVSAQAVRSAEQETAALQKKLSGVTNFAAGFQKLIGAYFVVTQAAQAFGAVVSAGNELEKTEATFKALSGSAENYAKNLQAAKDQQARFGGSLNDTIDGLSGFANLAKRTGVDITQLANTARALAIVDPAQGFKGASIALKEFFSGDITSLARRFEIPRDRLNELKELAQTDAPAAFQKLQGVLEEFGISQSLLAAQANTTAVAYDKLGGAAADAFAKVGQLLSQGLEPAAVKLTNVLTNVSIGLDNLSKGGDKKLAVEQAFLQGSASADEFNNKVVGANATIQEAFANTNIGILAVIPGLQLLANQMGAATSAGLQFQQVTQGQFEFLQKLQQSGKSMEEIRAAMQATSEQAQELDRAYQRVGDGIGATKTQWADFVAVMLQAGQQSQEGAIAADAFFNAVVSGEEGIGSATARLQAYLDATRQATAGTLDGSDAHERHAAATDTEASALSNAALEAINAEQATTLLKQRQEEIVNAALAAAGGLGAAGNAAVAMAQQFGIAESKAADLINMLNNLRIAQNLASATSATEKKFVGINALAGRSVDLAAFRDQEKALAGVNDALRDQQFQAASAAGQIKILKDELSKLGPGTEAYIRKQTEINKAEDQLDKHRKRRSGGTSPKLSANEKLNNQLLAQQDKFDNQMEDLEGKHQQRLLDILADFAKKQLETQKQNETLKRRSRFDFYTDLNKSQLSPIDRQAFAKAYEDAFNEAQRIAQSGRAKLAQEFLQLKQQHIQELKDLAEEEANIRTDKDLSKGEKNARLTELEGRRKLLQDAQKEEEKQLIDGGDKIQNDVQDRLAEENKSYDEQADKIILAAERGGEAKVRQAERSKVAVDEENKSLLTQESIYDRIRQKNGGVLPANLQPTATPNATNIAAPEGTPAPITAPEAIPVKTDIPLAIAPPESLIVKQFELFVVRDQGVIDALGDQTLRLEGKLDKLVQANLDATNTLGGKLDQIKTAVNNIKSAAVGT